MVGERGLLPAAPAVDRLVVESGSRLGAFRQLPSLFVFTGASDTALTIVAWVGVALSLAVALGATNAVAMVVLWALYMSIEHVGQTFYNFGWEIQLLETGILAAFLCPLRTLTPFPKAPPSPIAVWSFRWQVGVWIIADDRIAVALEVEGQAAPHDTQAHDAQRVLLLHKFLHNSIDDRVGFGDGIDPNCTGRLFQNVELATQHLRPHEVPLAPPHPRPDRVMVALQIDEPHPSRIAGWIALLLGGALLGWLGSFIVATRELREIEPK